MKGFYAISIIVSVIILIGVIVFWKIANSLSGSKGTDPDSKRPDHPPAPLMNTLEQFRLAWDSESTFTDWSVVKPLATMSNIAYQAQTEADVSFRKIGFENIVLFSKDTIPDYNGSMVAYVVSVQDITVIVFRGTDDPSDWIVNLDCLATSTPYGEIHEGFFNAYNPLQKPIRDEVQQRSPKYLWITGHSLGGALALICANDMAENEKINLNGVVTFGQPRVVRQDLADHLNKMLLRHYARIVNNKDIVTRIPPTYVHFGSWIWFTKDGFQQFKQQHPLTGVVEKALPVQAEELPPLTDEQFEQLKSELRANKISSDRRPDGTPIVKGFFPWIEDHSMTLYIEKIDRFLKETGSK